MKLSSFNNLSQVKTIDVDFTRNQDIESILRGQITIATLCQEIVTITGSQLCAVVLISPDKPFNIVYSTKPSISFCQDMPLLAINDEIVISNRVSKDPRNGSYYDDERRPSMIPGSEPASPSVRRMSAPTARTDSNSDSRTSSSTSDPLKCPIKKMLSIPIRNDSVVYGKIILANRRKGYSANTLASVDRELGYLHSIIISQDDNLIFSNSRDPQVVFLSSLSHEIRTPIHGIVNMISLLSTAGPLNDKQNKYISCALASCEELIETVSDSIDYQKIKNNSLGIVNDSFNLKEMLTNAIALVKFKAEQKGIGLNLIIGKDVPDVVFGDKDRIRQVLLNIIGNAIKFTTNGRVTIKVDQYPSRIIFSVIDTGCGIKKENLSKIFTEYYQEEKYSKNGLGLGLSLSKKLVQMMGGGVSVTSEPNVGSTFTIDLPLAEERYFLDFSSDDDKELSVLVVDPVENNRIILRKFIKQWKITVDTVSTYKEAKKLLDDDEYDVVMINPTHSIAEAFTICHFIDDKHKQTRIVSIGDKTENPLFDAYISDVGDKTALYNTILSVKKKRVVEETARVSIRDVDYRVCIVEDDFSSDFALREILISHGVKEGNITSIDNGEFAVRNITHNRYNIVFMDCKLKGDMDGIKVTQILKSSQSRVKIIGMTASITEEEKIIWLNSGLDGLIIKPFSADAIYRLLA